MAKRKRSARKEPEAAPPAEPDPFATQVFTSGDLSLHALFQQQARAMLDRSDLSEDQKQEALVAMACPCCGVGAMAYTVKLKR
jgi:hypothetical protein